MTKKEAIDLIFSDGQPVFRHIEEARKHLHNCLDWQQQRVDAANYLSAIDYKEGYDLTGEKIKKEEDYTYEMLTKLLEIIGKFYKKIGID